MAATNDAGKILITPKGEYNGSTTYEILDAVYYISSSVKGVYVAKGTTTGNLPTDTTKWDLFIDLSTFVVNSTLATANTVGLVKPDGITEEVDALGVLTALGVVIKAEIDSTATPYGSAWLKVGTTTLTPSTKQMYRVTESGHEHLYYWNGTNYVKVATGHIIVNSAGTEFTQRSKLKISGATIVDDPSNDQTLLNITGGGGGGIPISLIEDTVGWTGKNRAYSQENNAVIADIKNGVTYNVSWTGSAMVTLRKNSSEGTEITHGSTSPLSFTADSNYSLYFGSSADVTQIMVCDSALDGEYEDYHDTVETMFEEEIHGVNLFKPINVMLTANTTTVGNAAFTYDSTISAFVAKVKKNTNYVALRKGGNRFSLALSKEYPATSGSCYLVYNNNDAKQYSFNSGDYEYACLYCAYPSDTYANIKPMLYKTDIDVDTYRPYNQQSIQNQLNVITGKAGVRNLWRNNANTKTENGVTWTVNSDGTITASGTPTGNTYLHIKTPLKPGKYIVNGLAGTSNINYDVIALYKNNVAVSGFTQYAINNTGDTILDLSGYDFDELEIGPHRIQNNVAVSGTIKPMIRLASDPDDTYVPYAMTNRELTEVVDVTNEFTFSSNVLFNTDWTKIYKCGNIIRGSLRFTTPSSTTVNLVLVTAPAGLQGPNNLILGPVVELWTGAHVGVSSFQNSNIIINTDSWQLGKSAGLSFSYPIVG